MTGIFAIVVKGSKGAKYEIKFGKDGVLYCTCPAWKFASAPVEQRVCKHMKQVAAQLAAK